MERVVAGEEVDKARVDAAKYIVDRCLGRPGSSQVVSGTVHHEHDVGTRYTDALKELAVLARAERHGEREANGRELARLKIIDVKASEDAENTQANEMKTRYVEKMRSEGR